MVAKGWVDFNASSIEVMLDGLGDVNSVVSDFFVSVAPNVVSRVVANPSNKLGLKSILIISDEFEHAVQDSVWNITVVVAPVPRKS